MKKIQLETKPDCKITALASLARQEMDFNEVKKLIRFFSVGEKPPLRIKKLQDSNKFVIELFPKEGPEAVSLLSSICCGSATKWKDKFENLKRS